MGERDVLYLWTRHSMVDPSTGRDKILFEQERFMPDTNEAAARLREDIEAMEPAGFESIDVEIEDLRAILNMLERLKGDCLTYEVTTAELVKERDALRTRIGELLDLRVEDRARMEAAEAALRDIAAMDGDEIRMTRTGMFRCALSVIGQLERFGGRDE